MPVMNAFPMHSGQVMSIADMPISSTVCRSACCSQCAMCFSQLQLALGDGSFSVSPRVYRSGMCLGSLFIATFAAPTLHHPYCCSLAFNLVSMDELHVTGPGPEQALFLSTSSILSVIRGIHGYSENSISLLSEPQAKGSFLNHKNQRTMNTSC